MNFAAHPAVTNSACFFELRGDGQILYSRFRQNTLQINRSSELAGHNFFDDCADFENVKDFRQIFNRFVKSSELTNNFVFECRFKEKVLPVRVMLLRAFEDKDCAVERGIILDIRNNCY